MIEALKALRDDGWSVAVHDDYRQDGEAFTFWLFTKGTHFVKGEGVSDADALGQCREAARRLRTGGTMSDSQMRAMIDQACEDLGRHGLQATDEAAQVVLNLIASASELGRLVDHRNEPSAVEALRAALREVVKAEQYRNYNTCLECPDPRTEKKCMETQVCRNIVSKSQKIASRALTHATEEA